MPDAGQAGMLIDRPQHRYLQSGKAAEQQGPSRPRGATEGRRQRPQRGLQNVGDDEIEARTPMIGRFGTEVDFDPMSIERGMCVGAGQCNRIDVGAGYETRTARSRNTCKQPRTGSYIQYRFRSSLPAMQVDGRRAQACGRVRSVPEHDRVTRDRWQQSKSYPAGLQRGCRRASRVQGDPGSDIIHEPCNPKAILTPIFHQT